MTEVPPGGESVAAYEARCAAAWARVVGRRAAAVALAVVTQGRVLRAWLQSDLVDLADAEPPGA